MSRILLARRYYARARARLPTTNHLGPGVKLSVTPDIRTRLCASSVGRPDYNNAMCQGRAENTADRRRRHGGGGREAIAARRDCSG